MNSNISKKVQRNVRLSYWQEKKIREYGKGRSLAECIMNLTKFFEDNAELDDKQKMIKRDAK